LELTGKCKEEFEEWFEPQPPEDADNWDKALHGSEVDTFNTLPRAMKYGVYVDYGDSVGIKFWVAPFYNHDLGTMKEWAAYDKSGILGNTCNTRQEARTKAIEKLDETRNEQLNK
tara:strand:+ start:3860 stop:4204 length:345 start_codon:yes stop_codon:yes gene_type:complete